MAKSYPKLGGILKKLLFDNNMKASDLAREVNLPPPTIHRLITGKSSRPYKSSLEPIADFFSVKVEQLLGEEDLKLKDQSSVLHPIRTLPLIPWADLGKFRSINSDLYSRLPFIGHIGDNAFGTILDDSSMEPIFSRGSVLIFDAELLPKDRSYVLVRLEDDHGFIFRQLLVDADHKYLKPLNPDLNAFKMRLLRMRDEVVAVLVEARQAYS